MKKVITSLLLACTFMPAANAQDIAEHWIEQSHNQGLADNRTWHQLLHYETGLLSDLESEVATASFFIAHEGRHSPEKELDATIRAMLKTDTAENQSAQCRFPARKLWLEQVLPGIDEQFPAVNCPDYQQHKTDYSATSLSLLYASGYLGNPASMYGHLLIKLNNSENAELLENTLNYGAMVPPKESKLKYIGLGISGGYQARFSSESFHRHSKTYNESELRNLWEYELDLTQSEIDFLLAHHWELRDKTFTYYFFKQNCAYQIAKLFELVIDRPLMDPNKPWVMPYDVIAAIAEPAHNGQAPVSSIRRHESRQEAFHSKYHQLAKHEQKVIKDIAADNRSIGTPAYASLDAPSKKRIVETLFDYYSFLEIKQDELTPDQKEKRRQLLAERFALSTEPTEWSTVPAAPPHEAQRPTLFQVSPTYNSENGEGLELRFRANYYDLLSLDAGRLPFSELSMFDLKMMYRSDELTLKSLDLFNIQNFNVSSTGLPYDGGYSWSLRAGVGNVDLRCDDCLVARVSGAFGKSHRLSNDTAVYGMLDGTIQAPDRNRGHLKAGIKSGVISRLTPAWRTSFAVGYHYYLDNTEQHDYTLEWEQRFGQARDWDIRTNISYDGATEFGVSYRYYF